MGWRTFYQGSVMVLGICLSTQAMAIPGLVLGSFSSQDNADALKAEIELVLREPVRLVTAMVEGRQLYRVVAVAERLSLDQLRSRSVARGLGRGWRIDLPSPVVKEAQQTVMPVAPRVSVVSEESTAVSATTASKADPLLSRAVKSSMVALGSGGADVDIQIPEFAKGAVAVRLGGRLDEGF